MTEQTQMILTKLDAARRQFKTAIYLWFTDGDPVSIHTLVAASYQVISDLLRHQGKPDYLYDSPSIRPERRKEWAAIVRSSANFFKHADRDPDAKTEFDSKLNGLHMLQCVMALPQLSITLDEVEHAFWVRFALENPDLLKEDVFAAMDPKALGVIKSWNRPEFLRVMLTANAFTSGKIDVPSGMALYRKPYDLPW